MEASRNPTTRKRRGRLDYRRPRGLCALETGELLAGHDRDREVAAEPRTSPRRHWTLPPTRPCPHTRSAWRSCTWASTT